MDAGAPMDANSAPTAILFLFIKIHREDPVLDRVAGVEIDRAHNPSSPP